MSSPIWSSTLSDVTFAGPVTFNSGFTIAYGTVIGAANVYTPTITNNVPQDAFTHGTAVIGPLPFSYYITNGILRLSGSLSINFHWRIAFKMTVTLPSIYKYITGAQPQVLTPAYSPYISDATVSVEYRTDTILNTVEIRFTGVNSSSFFYDTSGDWFFTVYIPVEDV